MRLRVVPGFISPPPGFGGLGYTPTARACVNISIPLQSRVIEMLDVFTPLLKLFAKEPHRKTYVHDYHFWPHSLADTERVYCRIQCLY